MFPYVQPSARPNSDGAVLAAFNHVAVLYSYMFDDGQAGSVLIRTGATVPVSTISLVVNLDHVLASCRDNTARIEHHAGYGMVVCICVVY
jgi:hypothetical protein